MITGTVKAIAGKYHVKDVVLDQPMLSCLIRIGSGIGWCKQVGEETGGRGKNAKVWEFTFPFEVEELK